MITRTDRAYTYIGRAGERESGNPAARFAQNKITGISTYRKNTRIEIIYTNTTNRIYRVIEKKTKKTYRITGK
jgi:hypothetical protein